MRTFLILTLFLFFAGIVSAHSDFWITHQYGNIKVRVKTGYEYGEIYKCYIIGKLSEKLSKELNYSDTVFLDFDHYYVGECKPVYFISFDKGGIQNTWNDEKEKDFLKNKSLIIRQVSSRFNPTETLKLLEYAIKNVMFIKATQRKLEYNENYCQWKVNSIDTGIIKQKQNQASSDLILKTLNQEINLNDKEDEDGLSYYWRNGKFNLVLKFYSYYNKSDTLLLSVDDIFMQKSFGSSSIILFDTDSSFYYISRYAQTFVSKRQVIKNINGNYRPFKIKEIGGSKLSIYFDFFDVKKRRDHERTLIYLIESDELIQDLDLLIDKH